MGDIVWHGHHENVCPIEELSGTIAVRQEQIQRNKPEHEQAIRLRLLQPCSPQAVALFRQYEAAVVQLFAEYSAAEAALRAQYSAAVAPLRAQYEAAEAPLWAQYSAAVATLLQPILDLHRTECGCTEWDGKEIVFPKP